LLFYLSQLKEQWGSFKIGKFDQFYRKCKLVQLNIKSLFWFFDFDRFAFLGRFFIKTIRIVKIDACFVVFQEFHHVEANIGILFPPGRFVEFLKVKRDFCGLCSIGSHGICYNYYMKIKLREIIYSQVLKFFAK
jgi:hypothetical protein